MPKRGPYQKKPWQPRFWEKVQKTDGCWIWTAGQNGCGYAQFSLDGKPVRANRLSWEMHYGPIESPKMFVCHKCDNPLCVRPDHLFLGTNADNMKDAALKGRMTGPKNAACGEQHHNSKLTWGAVEEIRRTTTPLHVLAKKFGVSVPAVWNVRQRNTWVVGEMP